MVQYYVVLCEDFCSLVPEHWVYPDRKFILWPPKHIKLIKTKMHQLQTDDRWIEYKYRILLGPFETFEVANQVEEHCTNASTNDDTDDVCAKALMKPVKKRVTKKPARLEETSEEETTTDDDIGKSTFVPPPSNYQAQQGCDHSAKKVHPTVTIPVPKYPPIDIPQHSSILENENLSSHNAFEEPGNFDAVFEKEIASASLQAKTPSRDRQNVLATNKCEKQSQNTCKGNNKIFTARNTSLKNPCKRKLLSNTTTTSSESHKGAPLSTKKLRTVKSSNVQEDEDDSGETDEEQLDITDRRRLSQQGNARSELLTEKRYLKCYKAIMMKLNHVINQLQDRGRLVPNEEVDNLLPDFPLETSEDLENFDDSLQSTDVRMQFTHHIQLIGGADAAKLTRGILRNIMTDQLALIYSWSGQQNTKKFKTMKVCQVIIGELMKMKTIQGYIVYRGLL